MSPNIWHNRLGHPAISNFNYFSPCLSLPSSKNTLLSCNACSLGKHCRLPFNDSIYVTHLPFDIIHADIWTSPVTSKLKHKYYLVLLDDFHITLGHALSKISLKPSFFSFTLKNIFKLSFQPPLSHSNVTMAENSILHHSLSFSPPMTYNFGLHVRILLPKMVKWNA